MIEGATIRGNRRLYHDMYAFSTPLNAFGVSIHQPSCYFNDRRCNVLDERTMQARFTNTCEGGT